jgi:hypothetical protein
MENNVNGIKNNLPPTLFWFSIHYSFRYKKDAAALPWLKAVFSCYSATEKEAIKIFENEKEADVLYTIDKIERSPVTWEKKV